MQSMMPPPFPQLKGEETIAVLNSFMKELGTRNEKFTKEQIKTLKKFHKGITISKAERNRT